MSSTYNNNNDTYATKDTYASNNNQNQDMKNLQDEQIQQQYKADAENALDNIIHDYSNAITNQLQSWNIDISDRAKIVRYYNRYWNRKAFLLSFLSLLVTFAASFYTIYAIAGIFIVFLIQYLFSAESFFALFTKDHEIAKEDLTYIQYEIFEYRSNSKLLMFEAVAFTIVSFVAYIYSSNILIDFEHYQKLVHILHINIDNELFAYANFLSILILIFTKIFEKWR